MAGWGSYNLHESKDTPPNSSSLRAVSADESKLSLEARQGSSFRGFIQAEPCKAGDPFGFEIAVLPIRNIHYNMRKYS